MAMKRIMISSIVLLLAATLAGCAGNKASRGWITLLDNGSGIENFVRVGDANWRVQDGAVMADKGGKTTSHLVSRERFTDFVLYAEFWVNDDANSGIFIRLSDPRDISSTNSYEVNIYDKRPDPSFGTGAIVNFAKVSPMPKAGGKWNSFEITARGPQLTVKMNGVQTASTSDRSFFNGPFSLQYCSGIVKFRKVQVLPLDHAGWPGEPRRNPFGHGTPVGD
jgi:Domain of Unknown Function (DUF1080)